MWIPAIVTAGKPATEPAGKSGSPGRHPVRRSWPVKDGLAKVEALAFLSCLSRHPVRRVSCEGGSFSEGGYRSFSLTAFSLNTLISV